MHIQPIPSYTDDEGVVDRSWSAALEPRRSATAATAELRRSACVSVDGRLSATADGRRSACVAKAASTKTGSF